MKKIKVGVIGTGHLGKLHTKFFKEVENSEIIGIYDIDIAKAKKHQKIIENLYQKMFKENKAVVSEKSLLPRLTIVLKEEKTSVIDLLELAMEAEKISEEFYDNLSEEVGERGVQEILQYLASMEHSHYFLLKGEYDLCMRDEMYYQRGEFQYDMVHIGP